MKLNGPLVPPRLANWIAAVYYGLLIYALQVESGIIRNMGCLKRIRKSETRKALIWGFEFKVSVLP